MARIGNGPNHEKRNTGSHCGPCNGVAFGVDRISPCFSPKRSLVGRRLDRMIHSDQRLAGER